VAYDAGDEDGMWITEILGMLREQNRLLAEIHLAITGRPPTRPVNVREVARESIRAPRTAKDVTMPGQPYLPKEPLHLPADPQ
jgi:hypothetical protein